MSAMYGDQISVFLLDANGNLQKQNATIVAIGVDGLITAELTEPPKNRFVLCHKLFYFASEDGDLVYPTSLTSGPVDQKGLNKIYSVIYDDVYVTVIHKPFNPPKADTP